MPEFYMILARELSKYPNFYDNFPKINKIPEFYMFFARKCPIITIIALKYFPEFQGGGEVPSLPSLSYAYAFCYYIIQLKTI